MENAKCLEGCLMEEQLQAVSTWLLTQIAGVPADSGDLLDASKCLLELETGQLLTVRAWLVTVLAGDAQDVASVLEAAKCIEGCLSARQQDGVQAWLLTQKAGVEAAPGFLIEQSKCLFGCLTWQQQLAIQIYLLATEAGLPVVAGSLLSGASACFSSCLTEEQAISVTTIELCHWANAGCPTITLAPATLDAGTCGVAYSQLITASGGTAPYTFAVTAGALPTGITLTAGGLLSGTAISSGVFNFTITATDAESCTGSTDYSLTLAAGVGSFLFSAFSGDTTGLTFTELAADEWKVCGTFPDTAEVALGLFVDVTGTCGQTFTSFDGTVSWTMELEDTFWFLNEITFKVGATNLAGAGPIPMTNVGSDLINVFNTLAPPRTSETVAIAVSLTPFEGAGAITFCFTIKVHP